MENLDQLKTDLLAQIDTADLAALEDLRVSALGKSGTITEMVKGIGQLPPEERRDAGQQLNVLKNAVADAIDARKDVLEAAALDASLATDRIDVTLPQRPEETGRIHPISQTIDEMVAIFCEMGFTVAEGPHIESDFNNFTALNIPPEHPARQDHDTFYLPPNEEGERKVLRTHTSPVQIRTMVNEKPPIRIVVPGRTFRADHDATHSPMFHQIEGLVIDKGITLGHLKWTLETFLKAFFEREDIVLRLRPSYFPFTEPSVEVDVGYTLVNGQRIIGGDGDAAGGGWLEVLGSGMVNRRVIEACGLDPDEWQGFAFGTGVDRLAMLKYGMNDLRAFFDGDLRWLKHYGFSALDVPTLSGGVGA